MFVVDGYAKENRKIEAYRNLEALKKGVESVLCGGAQFTSGEFEIMRNVLKRVASELGLPTPDPRTPDQLYNAISVYCEVAKRKLNIPSDPYAANKIDRL